MGSTSDERLNSIRTIAKELVEGALANCPRVGIEVPEILISDSTHGWGLTPNDPAQLPGRLERRPTSKDRHAGPVNCSGLFGPRPG
jgi:hypothetical protein